jgi:methyl acetate hydrolase
MGARNKIAQRNKGSWRNRAMQGTRRIDQLLRERTDAGEIPGVAAMAATGKEIIYQGAFGKRVVSGETSMTLDSVFWIASMTKAITATAAMQLVEQGRLSLQDPIGKLLPDLAAPQVLEGFDPNGEPRLRPAHTPITLRHLLTHTAGFCYNTWNGDMARYMDKTGLPAVRSGKHAALKAPVVTEPGTRWEYGINIDFVGKAIEAVSGVRLDAYLRDHVFAPLGMSDTGYRIGTSQRARLVGMHVRGADGSLKSVPFETEQDPEFHPGGGGLYSTAGDYIRFTQMILNNGRGNGHQLLKPETVALMAQNHIGDLNVTRMTSAIPAASNDCEFWPGMVKKWGLSFLINTAKTPEGRSPGSLAWAGLGNTYFWIDPVRDVAGVILMQMFPFVDGKCIEAFNGFERGIYDAMDANERAA